MLSIPKPKLTYQTMDYNSVLIPKHLLNKELGLKITPTLIPSSNLHLLFQISSALPSLAKLGPQDMESGLEMNASLYNKVNGA